MTDAIIRKMYQLVTDNSVLPDLMRDMESLVDGYSSALMIATPERNFMYQTNMDPEIVEAYNNHYGDKDVWLNEFDKIKVGSVVGGLATLAPHSEFDGGYLNDILLASECKDCLSTKLVGSQELIASYSVYRDYSKEAFDTEACERMALVGQHFRHAIALRSEFDELRGKHEVLIRTLEALETPMMLIQSGGSIVWANPAAEHQLAQQRLLKVEGGKLIPANKRLHNQFEAKIERVFEHGFGAAIPLMGTREIDIGVLYVSSVNAAIRPAFLPSLDGSLGTPLVLAKLKMGRRDNPHLHNILRTLFGLTGQQASVAELVFAGKAIPEIAAVLGIGTGTVRNHLKAIFQKTGTHRQSELLKLISQLT